MGDLAHATLNFYGWWQAVTCCFAFLALMSIWWHLGRLKNDYSQIWLALSVLCWSLTGVAEILFSIGVFEDAQILNGLASIFSLANSFFILLSLPWFKYIPERIKPIIKSKYWIYIIGLPFVFSILPTLSKMMRSSSYGLMSELDVYYSILTLAFLGWVLWESFAKRRLKLLAWLSVACIVITFAAQVYKLTGNELDMRLFSAIFKSTLIMLFFALALSWVKDLSEKVVAIPGAFKIFIKDKSVKLDGYPGKSEVQFMLSNAPYELLLTFANAKKEKDGWLEIKPKSDRRNENQYAIKDHNEIKRLTHAMLDGIYGKNNWTKEQHEIPFKKSFYETSAEAARKIRLLIPAENITIG
ncbi:hypothetical protein [Portibacter lacus]|uniref:Uncharacterized protein n=1 Tax=Portibacter lacus TaxID=1099794 RepID=A0AA37SNW9_9BACT|nr:hypothetical protein [Portibacter lacus]GLR16236.1 hypothetical protein GCM10007940_08510 [Portibacter lacus]